MTGYTNQPTGGQAPAGTYNSPPLANTAGGAASTQPGAAQVRRRRQQPLSLPMHAFVMTLVDHICPSGWLFGQSSSMDRPSYQ